MYEFKLPDVGEGIHEATIANWLIKTGDQVALDQPLVEIETDKALVQIPAPVAGTIAEIPIAQGATAKVGEVLVVIQPQGEASRVPAPPPRSAAAGPEKRGLAAPAVRKRALELGIDLRQVPGSAAGGRVTLEDLEKFTARPAAPAPVAAPMQAAGRPAAPPPTSAADIEYIPLQGLRKRIAERMSEAWRIPHVTSFEDVSVKRLIKLRQRLNQTLEPTGERLTYLPFIVKAVVQALKEFPDFNASLDWERQRIARHRDYHIGIATAITEGLLVPVLRHAERLSLLEIQRELDRLAALARERRLAPEELTGSTFTITNFGSLGGGIGTPIINPPESAILGCGRIEKRPLAVDGKLKALPVLPLALSFDHRLHDGAGAARFLGRLKLLLSDPARLLLHMR